MDERRRKEEVRRVFPLQAPWTVLVCHVSEQGVARWRDRGTGAGWGLTVGQAKGSLLTRYLLRASVAGGEEMGRIQGRWMKGEGKKEEVRVGDLLQTPCTAFVDHASGQLLVGGIELWGRGCGLPNGQAKNSLLTQYLLSGTFKAP